MIAMPIPLPVVAVAGVTAVVAAYCLAGVIAMAGVDAAAAGGIDSPLRARVSTGPRSMGRGAINTRSAS